MDILEKLFGSGDRVRIMRVFLFSPDVVFTVEEIAKRSNLFRRVVDKELFLLQKATFIRRKPFPRVSKNGNGSRKKGNGWALSKNFQYLKPMESLLIQQVLITESDLIKRLEKVGKLKLLLISGLFVQDSEGRVDLLIVCEHMKRKALEQVIKSMEAEIGKELRYAAFEAPEFEYRVKMYDKLIRDIFDFPHKTILNKLGLVEDR